VQPELLPLSNNNMLDWPWKETRMGMRLHSSLSKIFPEKLWNQDFLTVQIQFLLNQQLHWDFGPHIHQERQQTGSLER
jgi:hypothetical protein